MRDVGGRLLLSRESPFQHLQCIHHALRDRLQFARQAALVQRQTKVLLGDAADRVGQAAERRQTQADQAVTAQDGGEERGRADEQQAVAQPGQGGGRVAVQPGQVAVAALLEGGQGGVAVAGGRGALDANRRARLPFRGHRRRPRPIRVARVAAVFGRPGNAGERFEDDAADGGVRAEIVVGELHRRPLVRGEGVGVAREGAVAQRLGSVRGPPGAVDLKVLVGHLFEHVGPVEGDLADAAVEREGERALPFGDPERRGGVGVGAGGGG